MKNEALIPDRDKEQRNSAEEALNAIRNEGVRPVDILRMMLREIQIHSSDGLATLNLDYEVDQRLVDIQLNALERAVGRRGRFNRKVWTRIFEMNLKRSAWIQLIISREDDVLKTNPGDYFSNYEVHGHDDVFYRVKGLLDTTNREYLINNCLTEDGELRWDDVRLFDQEDHESLCYHSAFCGQEMTIYDVSMKDVKKIKQIIGSEPVVIEFT